MTRSGRTRTLDRTESERYRRVAIGLLVSADSLHDLAEPDSRYGNAIGVLAVHGAIAWADALCIAYGGRKSIDAHDRAPDTLAAALGRHSDPAKLKLLRTVIATKDQVSYAGELFTLKDGHSLLKKVHAFAAWAAQLYETRPPVR